MVEEDLSLLPAFSQTCRAPAHMDWRFFRSAPTPRAAPRRWPSQKLLPDQAGMPAKQGFVSPWLPDAPPSFAQVFSDCLSQASNAADASGVTSLASRMDDSIQPLMAYSSSQFWMSLTRSEASILASLSGPWKSWSTAGKGSLGRLMAIRHATHSRLAAIRPIAELGANLMGSYYSPR